MSREMDALVAEKVMEYDMHFAPLEFQGDHNWLDDEANYPYIYIPVSDSPLILFTAPRQNGIKFQPSTDIAAAWLVVEKMLKTDWFFDLFTTSNKEYNVDFIFYTAGENIRSEACEKSMPMAICKAALKAVE